MKIKVKSSISYQEMLSMVQMKQNNGLANGIVTNGDPGGFCYGSYFGTGNCGDY